MRQLLRKSIVILAALTMFGCGKEAPQENPQISAEVAEILNVLNGHFISGTESLGSMEYEEITFRPFDEPKEIISIFGKFTAYGTATKLHYWNDHGLEVKDECYFTVNGVYSTVSFWGYGEDGEVVDREDKRIYTPISLTSFKMRDSGFAVNTDKIYNKE